MRLRRSSERTTPGTQPITTAWDVPAAAAAEPVIHAPRASDLVAGAAVAPPAAAPTSTAPARAA